MGKDERAGADQALSRRSLLSRGAAAAGMLVASTPAARALAGEAKPSLTPVSADIWAPMVAVTGKPASAALTLNGVPVQTSASAGGFAATLDLAAGANTAVVQGAHATTSNSYVGRLAGRPTARIATEAAGAAITFDAGSSDPDPYSGAPIASVAWSTRGGTALGEGSVLELEGPFEEGEQFVVATVTDTAGRSDSATAVFIVDAGTPRATEEGWQPAWTKGAVLYGAVPPLFGQPPFEAAAGRTRTAAHARRHRHLALADLRNAAR